MPRLCVPHPGPLSVSPQLWRSAAQVVYENQWQRDANNGHGSNIWRKLVGSQICDICNIQQICSICQYVVVRLGPGVKGQGSGVKESVVGAICPRSGGPESTTFMRGQTRVRCQ